MALSIKNDEVETLARRIAADRGLTLTETVRAALKHYELVSKPFENKELMMQELRDIQNRIAAMPVLDNRTSDEILGYDENGLPS